MRRAHALATRRAPTALCHDASRARPQRRNVRDEVLVVLDVVHRAAAVGTAADRRARFLVDVRGRGPHRATCPAGRPGFLRFFTRRRRANGVACRFPARFASPSCRLRSSISFDWSAILRACASFSPRSRSAPPGASRFPPASARARSPDQPITIAARWPISITGSCVTRYPRTAGLAQPGQASQEAPPRDPRALVHQRAAFARKPVLGRAVGAAPGEVPTATSVSGRDPRREVLERNGVLAAERVLSSRRGRQHGLVP